MHPPPFCWGRAVEPPTKFSKRGDLTGPQLLGEGGVAGKERGNFFQGIAILQKNKLKSEIFNNKKSL